jgi:hypothetical protein
VSSDDKPPTLAGDLQLSALEVAELRRLDDDFDSRPGWHTTWSQAIWNWGRLVARLERGYGSQSHGVDDLVLDVRVRDPIHEFILAASPGLSAKLAAEVKPLDSRYLGCTVDGAELAEALAEPRPEAAWWWRRIPRFGPLHDVLRRSPQG